jgi:hypothetical protein
MAGRIVYPLIAVIGETVAIALLRFKILEKRMQMGKPGMGGGTIPACDQLPIGFFRRIEPGGKARMAPRDRLGMQEEAIGVAGDPGIAEIGLSTRAFRTKGSRVYAVSFSPECDAQAIGDLAGVVGFERAPDGEQDTPVRRGR